MVERKGTPGWAGRLEVVKPVSGAAAMATGILSVGLHLVRVEWLSLVFLALAMVVLVLLAALVAVRLRYDPRRWQAEADTPGALTGVAGTAVVGARLSQLGWQPLAVALLCVAVLAWLPLLPNVIRHRRRMAPGAAYLVCVSTQSLAVLGGTLSAALHQKWLLVIAVCLFVLGLVLYLAVLMDFDFGQLRTGAGDQWVACGAVSISTLAAVVLGRDARTLALILLGIALAWYAVLVVCEVVWPRLRYDMRRWATVFPLGMTAVAEISCGLVFGITPLTILGEILLWPAIAVWLAVAVGTVRRLTAPPGRAAGQR